MIKILLMVIAFVKELFIDNKNEINILHYQFSFKKSLKFLVVVFSLTLNYFLIQAIINITTKYNGLLERSSKDKVVSYSELVVDLHKDINTCQQRIIDYNINLALCNDKLKKHHLKK